MEVRGADPHAVEDLGRTWDSPHNEAITSLLFDWKPYEKYSLLTHSSDFRCIIYYILIIK